MQRHSGKGNAVCNCLRWRLGWNERQQRRSNGDADAICVFTQLAKRGRRVLLLEQFDW